MVNRNCSVCLLSGCSAQAGSAMLGVADSLNCPHGRQLMGAVTAWRDSKNIIGKTGKCTILVYKNKVVTIVQFFTACMM